MKIYSNNSKFTIDLSDDDFIYQGGQAKVYGKDKLAYKIYLDPKNCIPDLKFQELSILDNDQIIKPESLIFDQHKNKIGFSMKLIDTKASMPICRLFTRTFKEQENLSQDKIIEIVRKFQNLIQSIHSKNILVVDLNELNFLIDNVLQKIYAIDVDSYQTKHFPATAIMPSIADQSTTTFSEVTDWYSFAILSFQILIGIHPFRGFHPDFKMKGTNADEKQKILLDRMKKNISVFDKKSELPPSCYSFDVIPSAYKDWYKALFVQGKRLNPPTDLIAKTTIAPTKIENLVGDDLLEISLLQEFDENIIDILNFDKNKLVIFKDKYFYKGLTKQIPNQKSKFIYINNNLFSTWIENDQLKLFDCENNKLLSWSANANSIAVINNEIYFEYQGVLSKIEFMQFGTSIIPSCKYIKNVLTQATQYFDNVIFENILGNIYCFIPQQFSLPELNNYKIIEATHKDNILIVLGHNHKTKQYDRFIFSFNLEKQSYVSSKEENVNYDSINLISLPKGIKIMLTNEKLTLFTSSLQNFKNISHSLFLHNIRLTHDNDQLQFIHYQKIYTLKMKK